MRRIETANPLDVALGERVRVRRKAQRISQSDLAEALGVSFQQVQKYERGSNRISFSMLVGIAHRLGCSVGELVAGLDGPTSPSFQTDTEQALLRAYRAIPTPALKASVLDLVRKLGPQTGGGPNFEINAPEGGAE